MRRSGERRGRKIGFVVVVVTIVVVMLGNIQAEAVKVKEERLLITPDDLYGTWRELPLAQPSLSPDGKKLVFVTSSDLSLNIVPYSPIPHGFLWIANADGSGAKILKPFGEVGGEVETPLGGQLLCPTWSPDGKKIAFIRDPGGWADLTGRSFNIWVMDADGKNPRQLTFDRGGIVNVEPQWSPDGKKIVFSSTRGWRYLIDEGKWMELFSSPNEIWVMDSDGSNLTRLGNKSFYGRHPTWSPDGKKIAFAGEGIWVVNIDGTNLTQLTNNSECENEFWSCSDAQPRWNPKKWKIVFVREKFSTTNVSGYSDLWIMDGDGNNKTRLTTSMDAFYLDPTWSSNGEKIVFWKDGSIWIMELEWETEIQSTPSITPKTPELGVTIAFPTLVVVAIALLKRNERKA